jgi:hypothetical protein
MNETESEIMNEVKQSILQVTKARTMESEVLIQANDEMKESEQRYRRYRRWLTILTSETLRRYWDRNCQVGWTSVRTQGQTSLDGTTMRRGVPYGLPNHEKARIRGDVGNKTRYHTESTRKAGGVANCSSD